MVMHYSAEKAHQLPVAVMVVEHIDQFSGRTTVKTKCEKDLKLMASHIMMPNICEYSFNIPSE